MPGHFFLTALFNTPPKLEPHYTNNGIKYSSLSVYHSHPDSTSFSIKDIIVYLENPEIKDLYAVCSDGSYCYLSGTINYKIDVKDKIKEVEELYTMLKEKNLAIYKELWKKDVLPSIDIHKEASNKTLVELCDILGLKYYRGVL